MKCREYVAILQDQVARFAARVQQLYRQRAALIIILQRVKDVPGMPAKERDAIAKILSQDYAADELLIRARRQILTPKGH